nr:reverse transcriptase domain-containing protein [Tanacetum cinerariifolium]
DCKVKFATGTLTEEALSWWNSFAQPIGIEKAYKITWKCYRFKASNFRGSHYHNPEVNGSGNKAQFCARNQCSQTKFDDRRTFTNNNYQNNRNNNNSNRNNDHHQQQNRWQETFRAYAATPTENDRNCKNKGPATRSNLQPVSVTCHAYGEKGHSKVSAQRQTTVPMGEHTC